MNVVTVILEHLGSILTFAGVIISALISLNNKGKIREIHLSMNSRLDELLKSVATAARLEGAAHEKQRQADEVRDKPSP